MRQKGLHTSQPTFSARDRATKGRIYVGGMVFIGWQVNARHWPRSSSATFYKNKPKFGGIELSYAKRLRALDDENGKLVDECLIGTLFGTLRDARETLEEWQEEY
ncbi:hypothetical protein AB9F29_21640, partial [Falsihalocynthiibacter sp. S25ZX9]|uniref:hypothetical protein n=1 Tax=Falsihalocynthiibacter sp. S25ZX9 TaxID=3240870 RepID=UPI00350F8324